MPFIHVYVRQEEEGALPLIKHYFTGQEMQALVGKIMGKRPTELMQARNSRVRGKYWNFAWCALDTA